MIGLMVAGTASGVGKTTVTLALIAAMRQRGLVVQAFKGGPDFLDTGHHSRVAGRVARNVDTWMLSREANCEVVRKAARGADAIVVEGMMGVFDGKDGASETGSSAEIAKLLHLPVVLVLDASKSARSIAAVVLGFETFDPALRLAGVVLNKVGSEHHYRLLKAAITRACRTPILGWLPREPAIAIAERHLGLHTVEEAAGSTEDLVDRLAGLAEKHLSVGKVLQLRCGLDFAAEAQDSPKARARVGVARDAAYSFYYEDNFDLLREAGAEIVEFSPMKEEGLPDGLDAIYLGGGYPELYAAELSGNVGMKAAIREFAASGRPLYAECGGMIYLGQNLTLKDGGIREMCGVLPFEFQMTERLVNFGYCTATFTLESLLGPVGTEVRGHSFHYSRMVGQPGVANCYAVEYSLSGRKESEGFCVGSVLASYIHLHFRACPEVARNFVQAAVERKSRELVTA